MPFSRLSRSCVRLLLALSLGAGCIGAHAKRLADDDAPTAPVAAPMGTPDADALVVRDLPLAGNGYQRVLYFGPKQGLRGIIVMFPGGAGDVGIERDGTIQHDDNFVVRTREAWARRGYGVVIVDALDHQSMRGRRSTPGYAAIANDVLAYAHSVAPVPVWVMGTSQGSIAAMNAAAHALPGTLAGAVFTESVSVLGKSHETVFDADPQNVHAPALVVANRDDACWVAPPAMAKRIASSMRDAPVTVRYVQGGLTKSSNPCSSKSPHGYWGMDDEVVDAIAHWMHGAV